MPWWKSFEDLLGSLNIFREILENPSKKYLKNLRLDRESNPDLCDRLDAILMVKMTWMEIIMWNDSIIFLLPPQSPRGFSALSRLYYLARPTKTAMLRRLVTGQCFQNTQSAPPAMRGLDRFRNSQQAFAQGVKIPRLFAFLAVRQIGNISGKNEVISLYCALKCNGAQDEFFLV